MPNYIYTCKKNCRSKMKNIKFEEKLASNEKEMNILVPGKIPST